MGTEKQIKSVAIIGAGASGAITAAAFKAENCFDRIQVFERRATPGGTWNYDADPHPQQKLPQPGGLPTYLDPPVEIPASLPRITPPIQQDRFTETPVYKSLTTNVPEIAMSFSDTRFPYGPFVPHYVPRQYIENYFSIHKIDSLLVLNTTVEDVSKLPRLAVGGPERWKLTLRKHDPERHVDIWWSEFFDAVILGNGHYSVPYVPQVKGLAEYKEKFPNRVIHSKYYRTPSIYTGKKLLVIGNSASGHDIANELVFHAAHPLYNSIRSKSRWDGPKPPAGIVWKPVIKEYTSSGRIIFDDDTYLDDIDMVIYCTGYKPSYPFWNTKANGRPLWDYKGNKLVNNYLHTFFQDFASLAIVGCPRVLAFRSMEYQAIALARLFAGRNSKALPEREAQKKWEDERMDERRRLGKPFHDVEWETGETMEWLKELFEIAGLGTIKGEGRVPPVLGNELIWALEHVRKYPEHGGDEVDAGDEVVKERKGSNEWVVVEKPEKDLLAFI